MDENAETKQGRRRFFRRAGGVAAGAVTAAALPVAVLAAEHGRKGGHAGAFTMAASTTGRGGRRHVSRDRTEVHARTLGMCNNPNSPNYHKTTTPDTGPMATWVKWPALDA